MLQRVLLPGAVLVATSAGPAAQPLTDRGTQPPLANPILPSEDCASCHAGYDAVNDVEPWDSWSGSMMAQASRDPLFWAALDVAENDVAGIGEFCVRCHVPTGWLAGRSGTTAEGPGCGLLGSIDERGNDFDGVSCHLCHRVKDNLLPPPGQLSFYTENGQLWIDDGDCAGEPCRRGPYAYQGSETPPPHPWLFSSLHTESRLCGSCHNVTSPVTTLIDDQGVDTGIPFPIERTYLEWQQSAFSDTSSPGYTTCQNCHLPVAAESPVYACQQQLNDRTGNLPVHQLAGGNAWIPQVLKGEYPALGLDSSFDRTRDWALHMLQNNSAQIQLSAPDSVDGGDSLAIDVVVTNLTGHKLPTGYPEGRRMWLEIQVRDGLGALVWENGAWDPVTGVLTQDTQTKIYSAEPGIHDFHGTGECDVVDGAGEAMFHFVLNDCYAVDNRIPPLGFTGGSDLETAPVAYTYPETAPGSGVLVNFDATTYVLPVPGGTPSPLNVTATLRYQTASREYVKFLKQEAVDGGFPDDCIPRSGSSVSQTRGEILHDLWEAYGKSAPVDMVSAAAVVGVRSGATDVPIAAPSALRLDQNAPNPAGRTEGGTRIAFALPRAGHVSLDVHDFTGRRVRSLVDGTLARGAHSILWDLRDQEGRRVASGAYVYRLLVDGESRARRLVIAR